MLPEYFSHDILEKLFFIAGIITAAVATMALLYAKKQLGEAKTNSELIAKHRDALENQSRATLLLRLEEKWASQRIQEAKKYFVHTHTKIEENAKKDNPTFSREMIEEVKKQMFFDELQKLWENTKKGTYEHTQPGPYITLMEVVGFFELLGLLIKRGYITIDDIADLFAGPVVQLGMYMGTHLEAREREQPMRGLYANARYLIYETEAWLRSNQSNST